MDEREEFERLWEHCAPILEPATGSRYEIDWVKKRILAGYAVLVPLGQESACVLEVRTYPARKVLHIWLAGGRLDELMDYLEHADNYARDMGCSAIEVEGRQGWSRVLEDYYVDRVVLTKEL